MPDYAIVLARSARKELEALDPPIVERVVARIEALATEPRPSGARKLRGSGDLWRGSEKEKTVFAAPVRQYGPTPAADRSRWTATTRSYFMTRTVEGGCLCGEVRYRIQGEPLASGTCQCRTCRRASAAVIVPWLHLEAAKFSFIAGKPVEFTSSPPVTRTFCGRCGTPLTYWTTSYGPAIDVTTCSLDDPEAFPPIAHVWTSHKLGWVKLADGLPCLEEGPPSE